MEEKNTAFDEMNKLIEVNSDEAVLELKVKSLGYEDTLVKIENDKVDVTVLADEMSKEKANEIIFLVKSEVAGAQIVNVN